MASLTAGLASLATIATGVGGVISTAAAFQQNKFQQDIANKNAAKAREDAAANEELSRRDSRRQVAAARARFGAAGVEMNGSPLEVLGDLEAQAEEQALLARYGGATTAHNEKLRAKSYSSRAKGSLITGASQTLGNVSAQLVDNETNFGNAFPGFS